MLFASAASALNLGEIQVRSPLGYPFEAEIAVSDWGEAGQLKLRLASISQYKQLDLQYPYGQQFHFRLLEEAGKPTAIRVSSSQAANEPFFYLLVEVSTDTEKLVKTYAILLDPTTRLPANDARPVSSQTESVPDNQADTGGSPAVTHEQPALPDKQPLAHTGKGAHSALKFPAQEGARRKKPAMSLSISKNAASASPAGNSDALQEELIASNKQLEEMKLQISELQAVIQELRSKQGNAAPLIDPHNDSTKTEGAAGREVADRLASQPAPRPEAALPARAPVQQPGRSGSSLLMVIIVLSLMMGVWYLKYRKFKALKQNKADDLATAPTAATLKMPAYGSGNPTPVSSPVYSSVTHSKADVSRVNRSAGTEEGSAPEIEAEKADLSFCAQSTEELSCIPVPAEYALLMAADHFLRAGDEKSAEDALQHAIQENPRNIYGYIALLKLYGQRNDSVHFAEIAHKFKALGDEASFSDVAEQGRKMDPENPLYA